MLPSVRARREVARVELAALSRPVARLIILPDLETVLAGLVRDNELASGIRSSIHRHVLPGERGAPVDLRLAAAAVAQLGAFLLGRVGQVEPPVSVRAARAIITPQQTAHGSIGHSCSQRPMSSPLLSRHQPSDILLSATRSTSALAFHDVAAAFASARPSVLSPALFSRTPDSNAWARRFKTLFVSRRDSTSDLRSAIARIIEVAHSKQPVVTP